MIQYKSSGNQVLKHFPSLLIAVFVCFLKCMKILSLCIQSLLNIFSFCEVHSTFAASRLKCKIE